jgi:predicted heme/steroid binding protein
MPPEAAAAASPTNNSLGIAIALTVCTVSCLMIFYQARRDKAILKAAEESEATATDEDGYEVGVYKEIPESAAPKDGVFTIESLAKFNGIELPMCLALCGKVVNVSSSENFTPTHGYGKLWAGRETTYAMAKTSLKAEDANILDYKLADFSDSEATALAGWYKHFTTKYPVVGTLKEYDGCDWSSVVKEAETQNPFGINNQAQVGDGANKPAVSAADQHSCRRDSRGGSTGWFEDRKRTTIYAQERS